MYHVDPEDNMDHVDYGEQLNQMDHVDHMDHVVQVDHMDRVDHVNHTEHVDHLLTRFRASLDFIVSDHLGVSLTLTIATNCVRSFKMTSLPGSDCLLPHLPLGLQNNTNNKRTNGYNTLNTFEGKHYLQSDLSIECS